ncbi:membrane dipeptidase-domain-containing protein [Russula earlei]|uniref:Membrane dipeptidase-domain-containing protein n=1 Tax=Russula earlei TaxID=71964 RepID=A0ACC0UGZ4_9AGAM|nr:membrane dipeptidase-domain-containing protein [Russula earlei]
MSSGQPPDETTALLSSNEPARANSRRPRILVYMAPVLIALIAFAVVLLTKQPTSWINVGRLPPDPLEAAGIILGRAPVIDGHIDLAWLVRMELSNNITAIDLDKPMPGQVDVPRLRAGRVGGFFWSIYVPCPESNGEDPGEDFLKATSGVRDALEQIDISHQLIRKHSDTFQLALNARDVKDAFRRGKIAALLGLEGGHHLGNSLGALRQFAALGVRYLTLTHFCHNVFADSCGILQAIKPLHHGLSPFGETLVRELNRLGVLVDLSHTSDATAIAALNVSRAPVIWSHSGARVVCDVSRNVPDEVLRHIGTSEGLRDGVVMVNFVPEYVSADKQKADLKAVADHIDHIASITGRRHVGLGSDFDGMDSTTEGLEDVSDFPALIAEMYSRGWNADELAGLASGNFLRVFARAEEVAREMAREGVTPAQHLYGKRKDVP